jgi:hypothetical protein
LDPVSEEQVARAVLDGLLGLGGLQRLLDDPQIETINVNGCDTVAGDRGGGWMSIEPGGRHASRPSRRRWRLLHWASAAGLRGPGAVGRPAWCAN